MSVQFFVEVRNQLEANARDAIAMAAQLDRAGLQVEPLDPYPIK